MQHKSLYLRVRALNHFMTLAFMICSFASQAQSVLLNLEKQYNAQDIKSVVRYEVAGKYVQALFFNKEKVKANAILKENIRLAEQHIDGQYAAYLHSIQAINLQIDNQISASLASLNQAKKYILRTNNFEIKGYTAYCEGWLNVRNGKESLAVNNFLQAITFYEKSAPSNTLIARQSAAYKELTNIYANLEEYDLQEKYGQKALALALLQNDPNTLFDASMMMGYLYEQKFIQFPAILRFRDQAEQHYLQAINTYNAHASSMSIPSDLSFVANNLANLYLRFYSDSEKTKAYTYAHIAKEIALQTKQADHVAAAYGLLSEIALSQKQPKEAKKHLLHALYELNKSAISDFKIEMSIYEALAEISEQEGDFAEALKFQKAYNSSYKKNYDHEKLEITKSLEAQFDKERQQQAYIKLQLETERKEQQLQLMSVLGIQQDQEISNLKLKDENQRKQLQVSSLEAQKRRQELRLSRLETESKTNDILHMRRELTYKEKLNNFYILTTVFCGLILVSALYALTQRTKALNRKEKLHALELSQEKHKANIETLTALLHGQEQERARVARDLHDGLGGLLSGTKLQLTHFYHTVLPNQQDELTKSIVQIDDSVEELRRVAHNLTPDLLTKYGLETALKEFAVRMSQPGLEIDVQFLNYEKSLSKEKELICYRIIQELVHNAVKHAYPQQIIIQLVEEPTEIMITVEDDGIGFEITPQQLSNSTGMHNIQSRIDFLKGKMSFHSEKKQGTTVEFHFPKA